MIVIQGEVEGKKFVRKDKGSAGAGKDKRDRRARDAGNVMACRVNGILGVEIKKRAVGMRDWVTEACKVAPVANVLVRVNGEDRAVRDAVNKGLRIGHVSRWENHGNVI